jgi:hypothetical protein
MTGENCILLEWDNVWRDEPKPLKTEQLHRKMLYFKFLCYYFVKPCNKISLQNKMKRREVSRFGYRFRSNWFLKHVNEGKIEEALRRGRRRKQLLLDLKETRRYSSLKTKSRLTPCRRLSLEEVMDIYQEGILNE